MSTVTAFVRHLSAEDYDRERQRIRETYGDSDADAGALREQALADLFYRSGWTQEELAAKEGKSRQWIEKHVRFGRFLAFATNVAKTRNLSEGKFRKYWQQTDSEESNERIRFKAVQEMITTDLRIAKSPVPHKEIGHKIVADFSDGKWHHVETIAKDVEADAATVRIILDEMVHKGTYKSRCEKRAAGGGFQYRILAQGKKIDLAILIHEIRPILDGLKAEGKKNATTTSPMTVARLTYQLEQLITKLAE